MQMRIIGISKANTNKEGNKLEGKLVVLHNEEYNATILTRATEVQGDKLYYTYKGEDRWAHVSKVEKYNSKNKVHKALFREKFAD